MMEATIDDSINGNLPLDLALIRTKSDSVSVCDSESESEPYHDCDNCDNTDDDLEDAIDGIDCEEREDRDSLEFEYEPGISLASLQFYQTCECQHDSETGELTKNLMP